MRVLRNSNYLSRRGLAPTQSHRLKDFALNGQDVVNAGSPEWGTRGTQASPNYTTLKRIA